MKITKKTQAYVKEQESLLKKVSKKRQQKIKMEGQDLLRKASDIDYARVLYSSSFRRLQGKMQLMIPGTIHFHRNRLTHSLEVAQIARSLGQRLGMEDLLSVQTCALAHDLGNPPFGHAGEKVLNSLVSGYYYEGNAQTFRILTNIEDKFHERNGLNLTIRTLLGVVKYPYKKGMGHEKYLYDEDFDYIESLIEKHKIPLKTIDCQIMDLSDEIAYAAHDLEDALRWKYFNIDDLLYEFNYKHSKYRSAHEVLKELVKKARKYAKEADRYGTSEEYNTYFIKKLTSSIVNLLVQDIALVTSGNKQELSYLTHESLADGLKKLTFAAINRNTSIIRYENLGRKVIHGLFKVYSDPEFNKDRLLLPAEYRNDPDGVRTIFDYIGGMMDNFAIDQYKLYYGSNALDGLYS